jgi:tetratricopeptide (TPR) repeat protein
VHLERAVEVLGRREDERLAEAVLELAEVQHLRAAYDAALTLYERVRELRREAHDAWRGAAAVLRKLGRYDEALALLDEYPQTPPAPLLTERARNAFNAGDPTRALQGVRDALAAAQDDAARAEALLELVSIETHVDQAEFAVSHGVRALRLLEQTGNLRGQAQAHRMVGDAQRKLHQYDTAAVHLQRAISLAQQLGDIEEAAGSQLNLGFLHLENGDVPAAMDVTRAAAHTFERIGHGSGRAIAYGNLADQALTAGQLDEARTWAERSLAVAQEIGYLRQAAVAVLTLAEVDVAAAHPAAALERLPEARASFVQLAALDMVAYCDRVTEQAQAQIAAVPTAT